MSVGLGVRLGPLLADHREPLEAIVRATEVFSEGEVSVALELFDESIGKWRMDNGKWKIENCGVEPGTGF